MRSFFWNPWRQPTHKCGFGLVPRWGGTGRFVQPAVRIDKTLVRKDAQYNSWDRQEWRSVQCGLVRVDHSDLVDKARKVAPHSF